MRTIAQISSVAIALCSLACSSEMVKRSAYESMQNREQINCQQRPGSTCPEKQSYDDYQRSLKKREASGK